MAVAVAVAVTVAVAVAVVVLRGDVLVQYHITLCQRNGRGSDDRDRRGARQAQQPDQERHGKPENDTKNSNLTAAAYDAETCTAE